MGFHASAGICWIVNGNGRLEKYGSFPCRRSDHASPLLTCLVADRANHRQPRLAAAAPASCAAIKAGASSGRMPAKVSLAARANVTAGLAKEVGAVKQYAG